MYFRTFILLFIAFPYLVNATELVCNIKKDRRTTEVYLGKWLNSETLHVISGNKIELRNIKKPSFLDKDKYIGKILTENEDRLKWEYVFKSNLVRTPGGRTGRYISANSNYFLIFELRKRTNVVFFEGAMGRRIAKRVWGQGKCKINDSKQTAEVKEKSDTELIEQKLNNEKAKLKVQKRVEEKTKRYAEIRAKRLLEEKAKRELELKVQRLAEEKAEKIRAQEIEKENRLKVEQEKIKKKAAEVARKKKIKEEKERKKKLVEEKVKRKNELKAKKLAEEKVKQLKLELKSTKQKADNFYNDVNDFVKSGGDLDLLELSELYDLKPNPKNKWTKQDLTNFKNLENFVRKNIEFNSFEENKIDERKGLFEQRKSEIILSLNNNLKKLNVLFRENFSVKEFSKPIKQDIKKIKDILNNESKNFVIKTATNVLNISTDTIVLISNKIKKIKKLDNDLTKFNKDLKLILRDNLGKLKGKSASKLLKKIKNVKTTLEKEELNNQIKSFLKTGKIVEQKIVESAKKNSVKSVKKTSNNKNIKSKPKKVVKKTSKSRYAMNDELKKEYQYYFIVRACHEASQLYISQREFLKAKKYIKATDNFYKSKGINTDRIFKWAEKEPDRNTNAMLSLIEISKIGGFNSDTSKRCKLNFMFMKQPEKEKGKKDF